MDYIVVNSDEFERQFKECIDKEIERNFLFYTDRPLMGHGDNNNLFDLDYCNANGILTIPLYADCGACVSTAGDISFASFTKEYPRVGEFFIDTVYNFLKDKKIKCEKNKNDVIAELDGEKYKVASYSMGKIPFNSLYVFAGHVSYNIDEKLIEAICKKPQQKIPKGLSDFGVDAEELYGAITNALDNYK